MTFPLLLYVAKAEKHLRMYFRRRFSHGSQYGDIWKFNRFYKKQTKFARYSGGS